MLLLSIARPLLNMQLDTCITIESTQAEPPESPLQQTRQNRPIYKTTDDKDDGKKKHEDSDKDCLCGRKQRVKKCYRIPDLRLLEGGS